MFRLIKFVFLFTTTSGFMIKPALVRQVRVVSFLKCLASEGYLADSFNLFFEFFQLTMLIPTCLSLPLRAASSCPMKRLMPS